jgi:hypothetical protein
MLWICSSKAFHFKESHMLPTSILSLISCNSCYPLLKVSRIVVLLLLITITASVSSAESFFGIKERKYYKQCQAGLINKLRTPSTAKFQPYSKEMLTPVGAESVDIYFYVDAQNNFGAMVRGYYGCLLKTEKGGKHAGAYLIGTYTDSTYTVLDKSIDIISSP